MLLPGDRFRILGFMERPDPPQSDGLTRRGLITSAAGAVLVAPPVLTPWGDRNARVEAPDGMQLTLFTSGEPLPD